MRHIVAVASGKGGVGKSTVAANLAVALGQLPELRNRVALVDVDFYGPSIPILMGGGEISVDHEKKFIPASRWGVKYISIAFFLKNPDDPVVWRGPMFSKAITQLFGDVNWGDIEVCVVDMPPGTGDAQLSLSQLVSLSGAVVVTTPQEVALADVRRAINMFAKVNVPVLGLIENMAGFTTGTGERIDIFGAGGGAALAEQFGLPLLASIPINPDVAKRSDRGEPLANDLSSTFGAQFQKLARELYQNLNSSAAATQPFAVEN